VVFTTVFINLRFMMYSASLRLHFAHLPLRWRLLFAYLLADNVYGLTLMHAEDRPEASKRDFYLGAGVVIWIAWQAAVAAGIVLGAGVPASWRLEFAAPLAFVAMTIPLLRDRAMVGAALVAAAAVVLGHGLPLKLSIAAAALTGIAAGLLLERRWR
jgi:predicted branched-subunit amino acid permease